MSDISIRSANEADLELEVGAGVRCGCGAWFDTEGKVMADLLLWMEGHEHLPSEERGTE